MSDPQETTPESKDANNSRNSSGYETEHDSPKKSDENRENKTAQQPTNKKRKSSEPQKPEPPKTPRTPQSAEPKFKTLECPFPECIFVGKTFPALVKHTRETHRCHGVECDQCGLYLRNETQRGHHTGMIFNDLLTIYYESYNMNKTLTLVI